MPYAGFDHLAIHGKHEETPGRVLLTLTFACRVPGPKKVAEVPGMSYYAVKQRGGLPDLAASLEKLSAGYCVEIVTAQRSRTLRSR